ncbi:hypothetical protein ACFL6I_28145, partial [candidate division KSB1 bacterium]
CYKGKLGINTDPKEGGYNLVTTKPLKISPGATASLYIAKECIDGFKPKSNEICNPLPGGVYSTSKPLLIWKGHKGAGSPSFSIIGDFYTGTWTSAGLAEVNRYDPEGNYVTGGSSIPYANNIGVGSNVKMVISPVEDPKSPQTFKVDVQGDLGQDQAFMNLYTGKCKIYPITQHPRPIMNCRERGDFGIVKGQGNKGPMIEKYSDSYYAINSPYALSVDTKKSDGTQGQKIIFKDDGNGVVYYDFQTGADCKSNTKPPCKRVAVRNVNHLDSNIGRANMYYCEVLAQAYNTGGTQTPAGAIKGGPYGGDAYDAWVQSNQQWDDACKYWARNLFFADNRLIDNDNCMKELEGKNFNAGSLNSLRWECLVALRMVYDPPCTGTGENRPNPVISKIPYSTYTSSNLNKNCWWEGNPGSVRSFNVPS